MEIKARKIHWKKVSLKRLKENISSFVAGRCQKKSHLAGVPEINLQFLLASGYKISKSSFQKFGHFYLQLFVTVSVFNSKCT